MLFNINPFVLPSVFSGKCACADLMLSTGERGVIGREAKKGGDHQAQILFFCSKYIVDTVSCSFYFFYFIFSLNKDKIVFV